MPEMHGRKFEFPVIKTDLSPERRDAVSKYFMRVAERLHKLNPVRSEFLREKNVKKG